jgi:hypothetical protein
MYSLPRESAIHVPDDDVARDVLRALLRPDSSLIDALISAYLRLPADRGGYGPVHISAADRAALRALLLRHGADLLAALDGDGE